MASAVISERNSIRVLQSPRPCSIRRRIPTEQDSGSPSRIVSVVGSRSRYSSPLGNRCPAAKSRRISQLVSPLPGSIANLTPGAGCLSQVTSSGGACSAGPNSGNVASAGRGARTGISTVLSPPV